MTLTRLSALAGDTILPLAEAKRHLKVTDNSQDTDIAAMRDDAVSVVEFKSGIAFAPSQFRWTVPRLSLLADLPMGPVTEIDEITYVDSDGAEATYADFRLLDGRLHPAFGEDWPAAHEHASVTFTAGLVAPAEAPGLMRAVKLLLAHFFLNREATTERALSSIPLGVESLIGLHGSPVH